MILGDMEGNGGAFGSCCGDLPSRAAMTQACHPQDPSTSAPGVRITRVRDRIPPNSG